ncbi:restriction endonuclease subunit S [Aeromonas media]|uniref:restriction endonuclease subunit S n=1 Tax=Aeromonas media TaxID=651 RepID=UPI00384DB938
MNSEYSPLSEVADVVDSLHKTPSYTGQGFPMVRVTDVKYGELLLEGTQKVDEQTYMEFSRRYMPKWGDIIITRVGTYGVTARVVDTEFCLGQNTAAIIPRTINSRYLYVALNSSQLRSQIESSVVGSTQKTLSLKCINALQIPRLGEFAETKIAELMGALDDRIALLRETNATLEAIVQALFKSWFVDFDPVHARARGEEPAGLAPEVAALFPDSFEESELGKVPKGWCYSTVEQSFILTMGQSPPGNTYNDTREGLPFYQGRTDFGFRFPTQRVFCTKPTRLAQTRDTLVSVRAPVGDVNMALEACALGRGVAGVRHPEGHQSFVFYSIRGLKSHFELYDGEGTVFGSINKKDFQALPVVLPTALVLQAFESSVAPLDAQIESNELRLRTLADLRDTLLPRLISGQLRLPEAEAMVREVQE